MSIRADLDTLTARFVANFTSPLPIAYDLQPQADYPNGHVRFSVVPGASKHDCGDAISGFKLQQGRLWLFVELPDQKGDALAYSLVDQFCEIFRNWTDGVIVCKTEEFIAPSQKANGNYVFQTNIYWYSQRPYNPGP